MDVQEAPSSAATTPQRTALAALIFDVDGTLVDSVDLHARAWQEAFADFGYELRFDDIRAQIGKGGDQLIPVFVPKDDVARIGKALDAHRAKVFARRYLHQVKAFPKVAELFRALRSQGLRIALASSAKSSELGHYKEVAKLDGLIDAEATADEAERSKPYPDIFQAALQHLDNPGPNACVVIGDTPYDALAAARAGLHCIGMLCGGFPEAELRAAGCIAIYRDPADLLSNYDAQGEAAFTHAR